MVKFLEIGENMRTRPEHRTPARYRWEIRREGKACPECRESWTEYHRAYRKNRILTTQKAER
jgi:hypothetical protein